MWSEWFTREKIQAISHYFRMASGFVLLLLLCYMVVAQRIDLEGTIKVILIILGTSRLAEGGTQAIADRLPSENDTP